MRTFLFCCCLLLATCLQAQQNTFTAKGAAINGYDPVAYFLQQQAVPGNDSLSYTWNGAKWQFSTQANLDSFKRSPASYAPQFGGYCAYGMSQNHKAPTDPNAWTIVQGKLYLNYNMQVKKMWINDTTPALKQPAKTGRNLNNPSSRF